MIEKLKSAWRSKTIWFNTLGAAALVALPSALDQLAAAMPQLHEYLPENTYKTVGAIAVGGNIVLRFLTKLPLEAK